MLVATAVALLRADAGASAPRRAAPSRSCSSTTGRIARTPSASWSRPLESGGSAPHARPATTTRRSGARAAPARRNLLRFAEQRPNVAVVTLAQSFRCPQRVLDGRPRRRRAARAADRQGPARRRAAGEVRFWRAANERAQAQLVAAELERLIGREDVAPERCAVLVRSVAEEGQAGRRRARRARASPTASLGADGVLRPHRGARRARLAAAARRPARRPGRRARARAAPDRAAPRSTSPACVQIARRRRIDMVARARSPRPSRRSSRPRRASGSSSSSRSQRDAGEQLDPGARRPLRAPPDRAPRPAPPASSSRPAPTSSSACVNLAQPGRARRRLRAAAARVPGAREFARYLTALAEAGLGEEHARGRAGARVRRHRRRARGRGGNRLRPRLRARPARGPRPGPPGRPRPHPRRARAGPRAGADGGRARPPAPLRRDDARRSLRSCSAYAAAPARGVQRAPSPLAEEARVALGAQWEPREEELFGPDEALQSMFRERRDELLADVARLGTRLGELRFDTDLDVAHGVVRYLELVKLAALMARRGSEPLDDALDDVNARLSAAVTPLQREVLQSSPLDELLLDRRRGRAGSRDGPRGARGAVARGLPPAPRRRPRALGLRHRDLPHLPAALQVRARAADTARADAQPALRDPRPPGPRALPRLRRAAAPRRSCAARGGLAPRRLRRLRRGAPAAREGARRAAALPRAPRRGRRRAALVRALVQLPARAPPDPRTRRPRRRAAGRRLRADRLQDGRAQACGAAARRRPARALRGRRARGVAARGDRAHLLLRARRRARAARRPRTARACRSRTWSRRSGAGILAQGFEPTPSHAVCAMCEYRIACPAAER